MHVTPSFMWFCNKNVKTENEYRDDGGKKEGEYENKLKKNNENCLLVDAARI